MREKLQRNDFASYRFLSQLAFAPGGEHAAFVVRHSDWDKNDYKGNIHLCDGDGTNIRPLSYAGDSNALLWISDHELIFPAVRDEKTRERIGKGEKWTVYQCIDLHGGEARELMRVPLDVTSLEKLDDRRYVLLANWEIGGPDFARMTDSERTEAYARIQEERDYEVLDELPFWFNGKGVVNKKRARLFVFEPAANALTPVSAETMQVTGFQVCGNTILYCGSDYTDIRPKTQALLRYIVADGRTETLVAEGTYSFLWANEWDGEVAFLATDMKRHGISENEELFVLRDGRAVQLSSRDESPGSTCGSDCRLGGGRSIVLEGNTLYYTAAHRTGTRLIALQKDGTGTALVDGEGSIDCLAVHSGRVLAVAMRGLRLQELYRLDGKDLTRLSDLNEAIHSNKALSAPMPLAAQGKEGTVEGFVMAPIGYEEGKTYPAILNIHGGPKGTFGSVFFHEMQWWANEGYFVFYCNPRGGDGRGNAFADIRGKYGTIDYSDLMDFTDAVLAAYPQIDPNRVGVTGGSYGGFMTNWIIGHTKRFAAAVSQRSISNWISKSNTTDIGFSFNADQQQSTAWDNHEKLWWHSPLKYADQCVTPTLFLHSDQDYRCWMAEALQMFTGIRLHGVPSRICLFHGENHELSRGGKPRHRARRLEEMLAWFDRYLKA